MPAQRRAARTPSRGGASRLVVPRRATTTARYPMLVDDSADLVT